MTAQELVSKIVRHSAQLYNGQWESWQLLAAGAVAGVLLVLAVGLRRKAKAYIAEIRERSPIIGVRLAGRGRIGVRRPGWRASLTASLTALVLVSSLSALAVWVLHRKAARLQGPAKHAAVSVVRQAASLIGAKQQEAEQTHSFDRQESVIDKKISPLYVKYRNKYALLPVSGQYVELLGFDLEGEGRLYRRGCADAGRSLPDWGIGDYGSIPPRRILQILGPEQMLAAGFISEDGRVVHFKGWPTDGLTEGRPWPHEPSIADPDQGEEALEVAVVGKYRYRTLIGSASNIPSVVPLELFRKGITPEQFKDLLLSNMELPEDLRQLRSDITAIPATDSDEALPARTQPKLPEAATARRGAGSDSELPATSS